MSHQVENATAALANLTARRGGGAAVKGVEGQGSRSAGRLILSTMASRVPDKGF